MSWNSKGQCDLMWYGMLCYFMGIMCYGVEWDGVVYTVWCDMSWNGKGWYGMLGTLWVCGAMGWNCLGWSGLVW